MRLLTMVMLNQLKGTPGTKVFISDKYEFITLTDKEIIDEYRNKRSQFTNINVTPNGVESSNGAFERYGCFDCDSNAYIRPIAPVVLNRVEKDNKLLGYTVFMPNGTVKELRVTDAVKLHGMIKFANGKLKPTETGDIISSIEGNYVLRTISITKEVKETDIKFDIQPIQFRSVINKNKHIRYVLAVFKFADAYSLNLCYDAIEKDNKIITKLVYEVAGEKGKRIISKDELGITNNGTSMVIVISFETFIELWKKAVNKDKIAIDKKEVGCFDFSCTESDDVTESYILLDRNNQTTYKELLTKAAAKEIVDYTSNIIGSFK